MVEYKCDRCHKTFNKKSNYNYHINRKFKCNKKRKNTYICNGCDKSFYDKSKYTRHLQNKKSCHNKNNPYISSLKDQISSLLNKLEEQEEEIKKLKSTPKPPKPKVIINDYGKENIDYLTKEDIIHCLLDKKTGEIELFDLIHCNSEHPENHNIQMKKGKKPIFMKLINQRWLQIKDYIISKDFLLKSDKIYNSTLKSMSESGEKITNEMFEVYNEKSAYDSGFRELLEKNIIKSLSEKMPIEYY